MTTDLRAEIAEHARAGTLLEAIFCEYGRRFVKDDDPAIIALAELHNSGEIDVLGIITPESVDSYKGHAFFSGQQVYCKLISRLPDYAR